MVFEFERQVSRINASAFKGHLLDFILVDNVYASFCVNIHCIRWASFAGLS